MRRRIRLLLIAACGLAGCESFGTPTAPGSRLALGTHSAPGEVIIVNSAGDEEDAEFNDRVCDVDVNQPGLQCTLRAAIEDHNQKRNEGHNQIRFAVGTGAFTIALTAQLPFVLGEVTIDGTTQPGYSGSPLVELDGSGAGDGAVGLQIRGSGPGSSVVKGLVISGFSSHGILISGTPAPGGGGHLIERNYIGTDLAGTARRGNGGAGIFIEDTPNNTIRGNLIAGNAGDGILIVGRDPDETGAPTSGAGEQTIVNNIFGTDPSLRQDLPNGGDAAITITSDSPDSPEDSPGGESRTDSIARNTISGRANGIHISGRIPKLVKVIENVIGLLQTGSKLQNGVSSSGKNLIDVELNQFRAIDNAAIEVFARVGGTYNVKKNVAMVDGETGFAARIDDNLTARMNVHGNVIVGPRIGMDVTEPRIGGSVTWVSDSNRVQAREAGASFRFRARGEREFTGNEWRAEAQEAFGYTADIAPGTKLTLIQKGELYFSRMGDGQSCRASVSAGAEFRYELFDITSSRNGKRGLGCDFVVDATARLNLLSHRSRYNFNAFAGAEVTFESKPLFGVGVTFERDESIGNFIGIDLRRALFGNSIRESRIVDNRESGIVLREGSEGTIANSTIDGNGIGILIHDDAQALIQGNTITGNGVAVALTGTGTGTTLAANSIFANQGLGIDLGLDGVTPNDPGDLDTGPNTLQNYPELGSVTRTAGGLVVEGTLNSTPHATFAIRLFGNRGCHASGFGEGETFLGSTMVTTDGSGNADFTSELTEAPAFVTATATNAAGSTSEFSRCRAASDGPGNGDPGNGVPPALAESILALIARVESLDLRPGEQTQFLAKLRAALASVQRGNRTAARGQLNAFINSVKAQRGKKLSVQQADALIGDATAIILRLGAR